MNSTLESLQEVFEKMKYTGIDVTRDLKWGFYFFDEDRGPLMRIYRELKSAGYRLESLAVNNEGEFRLHVSMIRILTPEQLHRQNIAFNELADQCCTPDYDGWDVKEAG